MIKQLNGSRHSRIFHVNDTYKNVTDRLEILSSKITNENSAIIEKQQIFLTLIFGLFGSLQTFYPFFQQLSKAGTRCFDTLCFLLAFFVSVIISVCIMFVIKVFKKKQYK